MSNRAIQRGRTGSSSRPQAAHGNKTVDANRLSTVGSSTLDSISTLSTATPLRPVPAKRTIKVVLIGDGGSGKTSLRNHFLTEGFSPSYRATIGADFITKTLPINPSLPDGDKAVLQIWDTAGQERFQSLGSAFYRGADAVILAMDVTSLDPLAPDGKSSLSSLHSWYKAFMDKAPGPTNQDDRKRFCWVCAANKIDLVAGGVQGVDRSRIRSVLDELVPSNQPDRGADVEDHDALAPSGDKEPANPAEVLSRPDPNGVDTNASLGATPFQTPFNTLSAPPQPETKQRWSLSNLIPAKPSTHDPGLNRHQKRQSIQSIDVFNPEFSDDEESDQEDDPSLSANRLGFPKTPPSRKSHTAAGSSLTMGLGAVAPHDRRQRVDSTMSLNAPSVYHTPRGSTLLSTSPTPDESGTLPRKFTLTPDASISPAPNGSAASAPQLGIRAPSSSSSSTATARDRLPVPKTVHDLFQSPPAEAPAIHHDSALSITSTAKPLTSAAAPASNHSSISLPAIPRHTSLPTQLEQGFTLFYTSARTGFNLDRLFQHIVTRVTANDDHTLANAPPVETPDQAVQRENRENEQIRRTIRLASGKNPDRRWGCC